MVAPSRKSDASAYEEAVVPLLARRSCHLPGNNWGEDWKQCMGNNHLLFGICFHHPLHPVEWWERSIALVGSIAFGLAATNIAYMWDYYDPEQMSEKVIIIDDNWYITKGTIVLWSFGSLCHSFFDFAVWHIMACACCHPGGRWSSMSDRYKDCGSYILIPVVLAVVAFATVVVLNRASHENDSGNDQDVYNDADDDELVSFSNIHGLKSFSFLADYAIELVFAWFFYFPMVGTIMFSGILGCGGRLPILGGRPRDVMLYQESLKESGQPYLRV